MLAYPNAITVVLDLLEDLAPGNVRPSLLPNFQPPAIVVRRIGGAPDPDDITDHPIMLVACYGEDFDASAGLADQAEIKILSSPMTDVNGVLVDEARIYVGEQEIPDIYPDERRIVSTYQFGWRRQYRPEP